MTTWRDVYDDPEGMACALERRARQFIRPGEYELFEAAAACIRELAEREATAQEARKEMLAAVRSKWEEMSATTPDDLRMGEAVQELRDWLDDALCSATDIEAVVEHVQSALAALPAPTPAPEGEALREAALALVTAISGMPARLLESDDLRFVWPAQQRLASALGNQPTPAPETIPVAAVREAARRRYTGEPWQSIDVPDAETWLQAADALLPIPAPRLPWVSVEAIRAEATRYEGSPQSEFGQGIHEGLMLAVAPSGQPAPEHGDDHAVDAFAIAMKRKLAQKRAEGRGGWDDEDVCPPGLLSSMLVEHVAKGDPLDVGNFAMMLWNRGESIDAPAPEQDIELADVLAWADGIHATPAELVDRVTEDEWRLAARIRGNDVPAPEQEGRDSLLGIAEEIESADPDHDWPVRIRAALTPGADPEREDEWLVQDKRSIVGNSMLWWKKGGHGYSCDVREAERMTRERAARLVTDLGHFAAYPAAYIVGLARPHIDFQHVEPDRALTPERPGQEGGGA